MEIAAIPDDYFNTREYFRAKDRKYRDKGYIVDRYGRPVRKKKVKRTWNVRPLIWLVILFALFISLPLSCPPGFTVGDCERMDFLDTYIWTESKNYRVGNSECSHGVAFRTWAPAATSVQVIIQNDTSRASYAMR